jgi:5-methylcytosine-specific restriction endonuclease McrA
VDNPFDAKQQYLKQTEIPTGNPSLQTLRDSMRRQRKSKYEDRFTLVDGVYYVPCPECGKERSFNLLNNATRQIRTGALCGSCSQTGSKHHSYGKSLLTKGYIKGMNAWCKAVKERDQHCQVCYATDKLEAHHIFGKASIPSLALSLDNGITLCYTCHQEFHNLNGKSQIIKEA